MTAVTLGYVMKRATTMEEEVGSICDHMLSASLLYIVMDQFSARLRTRGEPGGCR